MIAKPVEILLSIGPEFGRKGAIHRSTVLASGRLFGLLFVEAVIENSVQSNGSKNHIVDLDIGMTLSIIAREHKRVHRKTTRYAMVVCMCGLLH